MSISLPALPGNLSEPMVLLVPAREIPARSRIETGAFLSRWYGRRHPIGDPKIHECAPAECGRILKLSPMRSRHR